MDDGGSEAAADSRPDSSCICWQQMGSRPGTEMIYGVGWMDASRGSKERKEKQNNFMGKK